MNWVLVFIEWLIPGENSLDKIFKSFNKMENQLSKFIDITDRIIEKKSNQVTDLNLQIDDHFYNRQRAEKAKEQVKNFLGL